VETGNGGAVYLDLDLDQPCGLQHFVWEGQGRRLMDSRTHHDFCFGLSILPTVRCKYVG